MSNTPCNRDFTHPLYWKVPVKPADNEALATLLERRRSETPGERVSAADVVRRAVHDAVRGPGDTSCSHSAVSGMMIVANEDLDTVAASRSVVCEHCDAVYRPATGWRHG